MILVTGAAGFIGFHFTQLLLDEGKQVIGIDNINDYYDIRLKEARLTILANYPNFNFIKLDLVDRASLSNLFKNKNITEVVHLAAQPGVRYSLKNPHAYVDANIVGFVNLIECCRHFNIKHFVYASSSSVYGGNTKQPFSESDAVDHPLSLYAATKKANELMAYTYSHLYQLPTTGLRFFTVYGPWGRPDMAPFLFARNILENKPIDIFNHGNMIRDFTYISDIVEGINLALNHIPESNYRIYNIGNNKPVPLMEFIAAIENSLGVKALYNMLPMQPGDLPATCADLTLIEKELGYRPTVSVEEGVAKFTAWFKNWWATHS